LAIGYLDK